MMAQDFLLSGRSCRVELVVVEVGTMNDCKSRSWPFWRPIADVRLFCLQVSFVKERCNWFQRNQSPLLRDGDP